VPRSNITDELKRAILDDWYTLDPRPMQMELAEKWNVSKDQMSDIISNARKITIEFMRRDIEAGKEVYDKEMMRIAKMNVLDLLDAKDKQITVAVLNGKIKLGGNKGDGEPLKDPLGFGDAFGTDGDADEGD